MELISREDVLEIMWNLADGEYYTLEDVHRDISKQYNAMLELPTIDISQSGNTVTMTSEKYIALMEKVERPTGKWIVAGNKGMTRYYVCSNCDGIGDTTMAYCPDCGAKMEGE